MECGNWPQVGMSMLCGTENNMTCQINSSSNEAFVACGVIINTDEASPYKKALHGIYALEYGAMLSLKS